MSFSVCGVALLAASCALVPSPTELTLPEGVYADAEGRFGTLRVEGRYIEFKGRFFTRFAVEGSPSNADSGRYEYKVREDGSVRLYGSSNSTYFLNLACCWSWDGTVFKFSSDEGSERTTFARVAEK